MGSSRDDDALRVKTFIGPVYWRKGWADCRREYVAVGMYFLLVLPVRGRPAFLEGNRIRDGVYLPTSLMLPVKGPGCSIFREVTAAAKWQASSAVWCCLQ